MYKLLYLMSVCVLAAIQAQDMDHKHPKQIATTPAASTSHETLTDVTLCNAARTGDLDTIKRCISKHIDINYEDKNRKNATPLIIASCAGHLKIVEYLISQKAKLEKRDSEYGYTALMFAIWADQFDIVQVLLKSGALVNSGSSSGCNINYFGFSPLMLASQKGKYKSAQLLIKQGAHINQQDQDGCTALMYACAEGHYELVKLLLREKALTNFEDKDGMTALMYACKNSNTEVVELLIREKVDINVSDHNGDTALHLACLTTNTKIIELLIQGKADINCTNKSGLTPIAHTSISNNYKTARLLMQHKSRISSQDYVAIVHAAFSGFDDMVELFMNRIPHHEQQHIAQGFTLLALASLESNKTRQTNYIKNILKSRHKNRYAVYDINKTQVADPSRADVDIEKIEDEAFELLFCGLSDNIEAMRFLLAEPTFEIAHTAGGLSLKFIFLPFKIPTPKIGQLFLNRINGCNYALIRSIEENNVEDFKKLLRKIKDLQIYDVDWNNPLHIAIRTRGRLRDDELPNNSHIIALILIYNRHLLNAVNKKNKSPLDLAAQIRSSTQVLMRIAFIKDTPKTNMPKAVFSTDDKYLAAVK